MPKTGCRAYARPVRSDFSPAHAEYVKSEELIDGPTLEHTEWNTWSGTVDSRKESQDVAVKGEFVESDGLRARVHRWGGRGKRFKSGHKDERV